jgi:hypothetical protein
MKTAVFILFLIVCTVAQAQNVVTTHIPGTRLYEHKFKNIHKLGDVGEEKYPHLQIYCKSNDSDMVVFKLKVERQGTVGILNENTQPVFDCDGDIWKGTNVIYESFPLKNGVLESIEFYAPMVVMEMIANADEVVLDIEGAQYTYPRELRQDFKELYSIVRNQDKMQMIKDSPTGQGINLE